MCIFLLKGNTSVVRTSYPNSSTPCCYLYWYDIIFLLRMYVSDVCSYDLYDHTNIAIAIDMQGFKHHVGSEHNMWDYIYFSLELDRTDSRDQNAIQLFVYHQV